MNITVVVEMDKSSYSKTIEIYDEIPRMEIPLMVHKELQRIADSILKLKELND